MIRVEVRKVPKRVIQVDEYEDEDARKFDYVSVKMLDFSINR